MLNVPRFVQEETEAGLCLGPGHTGCLPQLLHVSWGYFCEGAGFRRFNEGRIPGGGRENTPSLVQHECGRG